MRGFLTLVCLLLLAVYMPARAMVVAASAELALLGTQGIAGPYFRR